MRPAAIECSRLDVGYGSVQVLFDVSLRVEDGEMVALLGTNGAGKSTVLRPCVGLNLPTRGSVRLAGRDITWLDPSGACTSASPRSPVAGPRSVRSP